MDHAQCRRERLLPLAGPGEHEGRAHRRARASLSERERMDVIFNLTAQLRAGAEHGERYLQMIAALADDPEPEVLHADMESLDDSRIALTTPRSAPAFAAFVRTTFEPPLRRMESRPAPRRAARRLVGPCVAAALARRCGAKPVGTRATRRA